MAYGLEVYNSSGTKIVSYTDRLVRFVAFGTVTGNSSGYIDVTVTGMANNDTWGVALGDQPFLLTFNDPKPQTSFVKSTNNLRINVPNGLVVKYFVFRT